MSYLRLDEKSVSIRLLSVKKQLLLTNFPSHIIATSKRRQQAQLKKVREQSLRSSLSGYTALFEDVLSPTFLRKNDPTLRQRHFGHQPMLWSWLAQIRERLIEICATKTLNIRPFRREPRAVKRRPKSYQILTKHRHEFQEIPDRGEHYRKPRKLAQARLLGARDFVLALLLR